MMDLDNNFNNSILIIFFEPTPCVQDILTVDDWHTIIVPNSRFTVEKSCSKMHMLYDKG